MNKKGTCGCCQKRFVLNKDNTLRKHGHLNNFWGGKRVTSFCIGSDNLPLEISNVTYQISFNRDKRILAKAEANSHQFLEAVLEDAELDLSDDPMSPKARRKAKKDGKLIEE